MAEPCAFVIVDKPAGWTSHDVVARLRRRFGLRRVGHAGTLDPDATGVLVCGLGRATRLLRFFGPLPKRYVGEIALGVETDTLDASGSPVATHDMTGVGLDDVRRVAAQLTGTLTQIPPMVSAVKVDGQRLHRLARRGVEVDRPPREVTVHRFEITGSPAPGVFSFEVACSGGTYVRVLAADLGRLLGGGAHLRVLRRTAVGHLTEDVAAPPDDASPVEPASALSHLPAVEVSGPEAAAVGHGRPLHLPGFAGTGPVRVLDPDGALLAVYEGATGGRLRPAVVLAGGRT